VSTLPRLHLEPLTADAFAPFGHVIAIETATPLAINQGFATRWNDLVPVDVGAEAGRAQVCLFVATPRPTPIAITLMERHPLGSQLFYPLQDRPWAVVVCGDPNIPASYRAFRASGRQGVSYNRNIWHHPLLVLDQDSRFIVVDRAGPGANIDEVLLPSPLHLHVTAN
jgi:ureidoglycolate lyase